MANLVSILIPAFNVEKWIGMTIDSALNQTWSKKEIIIVDDGSKDKTLNVARKFESKNVKVISQNNQGASNARNKALEYAQGDFIQWLDADDLLAPNKISEQMKFSESNSESKILLTGPCGIFYWRIEKAKFYSNALWKDLKPAEWLIEKFGGLHWLIPACWLVSRKLTEAAGPWDKRLTLDDDGEYFCRLVAASNIVKFVRNAQCYYRQSVNQLSRKCSAKALESLVLSTKLCINYLISLEVSERSKKAGGQLLRHRLSKFYQGERDIIKELNMIAKKLGMELQHPIFGWKTRLIREIFGRKKAISVLDISQKIKVYLAAKWDEIGFSLSDAAVKADKK